MVSRKMFNLIIDSIIQKSPFQKKRLLAFLEEKDVSFFQKAEKFAQEYTGYLAARGIPLDYAIDAYLGLCGDMMTCHLKFIKTGCYGLDSRDTINEKLYQDETAMTAYMIGLAFSQFLWASHYDFLMLFSRHLQGSSLKIRNYLEIGPGHGLYLKESLAYLRPECGIAAVDISRHSIRITKSMMEHFGHKCRGIRYETADILDYEYGRPFDFVTMGEVLEHIERPQLLLDKLRMMLAPGGASFISTCVNCPARDHVYHFRSVEDIRHMLRYHGFRCIQELVRPSEELSMEEALEKKVAINYAAIIEREHDE